MRVSESFSPLGDEQVGHSGSYNITKKKSVHSSHYSTHSFDEIGPFFAVVIFVFGCAAFCWSWSSIFCFLVLLSLLLLLLLVLVCSLQPPAQ